VNPLPRRVSLSHGDALAEVSLLGGELARWRDHGRELLWNADSQWWPRSCPVLFPIVGRLRAGRARIDGRQVEMEVHGFAGTQDFSLRLSEADQVTLGLASNDATRSVYPFEFDLSLRYRLHDGGLEVTLSVLNLGRRTLPFALGLHPGFRWPFVAPSAHGHSIVFERPEAPVVPVITAQGLLSRAHRRVPLHERRLPLTAALFEHEALCFLDALSQSLRFESPDGAAIVVSAQDFPHWALWSKPGAPFLCVEAWTGYPDPEDFDAELSAKPSMRHLAPGAMSTHRVNLCFQPARLA
jgi:galactose mutarotase-like enzyme